MYHLTHSRSFGDECLRQSIALVLMMKR